MDLVVTSSTTVHGLDRHTRPDTSASARQRQRCSPDTGAVSGEDDLVYGNAQETVVAFKLMSARRVAG